MSSTADAALDRLLRFGFRREPILADDGGLAFVLFLRDNPRWHEVLLVYPDKRARAYRVPTVRDDNRPMATVTADVLLPMGDVVTTVNSLLSLPSAAHAARGHEEGGRRG